MANELLITPKAAGVPLTRVKDFDPAATPGQPTFGRPASVRFTLLAAEGEIDLATADSLAATVEEELRERNLALDVSGVGFIDSSGLKVLISAHARAEQMGRTFALVAPSQAVMNILRLTGTDEVLAIYEETGSHNQVAASR